MNKIFRFIKNYFLTIFVLLIILFLSTVSGEKVGEISWITIPYFDKIIHLGMYLTLSITALFEIVKNREKISVRKTLVIIVFLAILYGGLLELVQEYIIKTRSGDWIDFGFNAIGASLSIPFFLVYNNRKKS